MMPKSNSRRLLRDLIEDKCLLIEDEPKYELSNGIISGYYFDCKRATLDGQCLSLIAKEILVEIDEFPESPSAIGGLTMGADPIIAMVIGKAYEQGYSVTRGSIVRKEAKKHGTKNKLENQLEIGTKIVVVDDVITSGKSTEEACQEFIKAGYEIVGIIALVDRKAGGKERLQAKYGLVRTLFTIDDFPIINELKKKNGFTSSKSVIAQV